MVIGMGDWMWISKLLPIYYFIWTSITHTSPRRMNPYLEIGVENQVHVLFQQYHTDAPRYSGVPPAESWRESREHTRVRRTCRLALRAPMVTFPLLLISFALIV